MVVIELKGDGTIISVNVDQERPSTLLADLKAAVLAAAERGRQANAVLHLLGGALTVTPAG